MSHLLTGKAKIQTQAVWHQNPCSQPPCYNSYFPQILMGEGFLHHHHQINMSLIASEILISQRRTGLVWSCSRNLLHQPSWCHLCGRGLSKMQPLCLGRLFPSQAPKQSRHLAACHQITNQPHHSPLALAWSFGPNQKLMDSALQ